MIWIRVLILSSLLVLLQAHKHCMQMIRWGSLLQALDAMSNGISETCAHHYNRNNLCDPSLMLHQVELNAMLLSEVLKEVQSLYWKNPNPEHFIHRLQHTQHTLTPCTDGSCVWEIVNVTVREILQRLEKRSIHKRR